MREILFRGKRVDNGEWFFGNLDLRKIGLSTCTHIIHQLSMWKTTKFEVIPETVGQYTGLTDKKGKKIFEGDIIICDTSMYRHVTGIVKYSENASCYYIEVLNSSNDYLFNRENILIIGNIHDNPELLEELTIEKSSKRGKKS